MGPADQDRADAARYRWLRNPHNWTETGLVVCSSGGEDTCYGLTLDEAIDRERSRAAETQRSSSEATDQMNKERS